MKADLAPNLVHFWSLFGRRNRPQGVALTRWLRHGTEHQERAFRLDETHIFSVRWVPVVPFGCLELVSRCKVRGYQCSVVLFACVLVLKWVSKWTQIWAKKAPQIVSSHLGTEHPVPEPCLAPSWALWEPLWGIWGATTNTKWAKQVSKNRFLLFSRRILVPI